MSDNKPQGKKGFLKSLSIRAKLTIAFVTFSFLVFLIVGGIVLKIYKQNTIVHSFQELEVINNLKSNEVEQYFARLKEQTIILSDFDLIVNAAKDLKQNFRLFDSDATIDIAPSEIENNTIDLKAFYSGEYLTLLNEKSVGEYSLEDLFPDDKRAALLQYLFIAANPNDFDSKKLYDKPLNSGNYGLSHFQYQPKIRELALRYGIDDVYLIDSESGHIFYSLNKNPDFATSLLSGPYRNTTLAKNFKETNKAELKNHVEINDIEFYAPSGLNTSMFVSSPVFADGKKIAVLTFQINTGKINDIISNSNKWEEIGLGETGDINIIGTDKKLRSNTRLNIQSPENFYKSLRKNKIDNSLVEKIKLFNSTALILEKEYYTNSYKTGIDSKSQIKKYAKEKYFSVVQKLNIDGLNWNLVTSIDKSQAISDLRKIQSVILILFICIVLIAFLIGYYYTGFFVSRINTIKDAIKTLSKGEKVSKLKENNSDEISETIVALNQLNTRIDGASDFALSIGQGNFEMTFDPISERDKLGVSLNEMKTSLEEAKKEEQQRNIDERKRNWTTEGIATFSDLLRRNNDNLEKLSLSLVGKLVEYMNASLAGIFLINEDKGTQILELSASYAFDRHKFLKKEINFGEGLVGTCAQELKTIYLKEVPEDYIQITSGFGETKPKTILLVPMIVEDKIMGVIEIGSMNLFEDFHVEFVEKIGENIGSTLASAKINVQTAKLLEESKVRSEEMAAQEEEMRQNLEELQATQEEMKRIKEQEAAKEEERRAKEAEILNELKQNNEQMEKEKALMDALMENVPDAIYFKDKDSKFLRVSKNMITMFKANSYDEVLGKSDFDFQGEEHAKQAFDDEQKIIETGQAIYNLIEKETYNDGRERYVSTTKMPLRNHEGEIVGTFGISRDVSEIKELENKSLKRLEELNTKENELELEQSMFDALLELITDRVTIKDDNGTYLRLSKVKYDGLVNQGVSEPIGKSDLDIFGKEHHEKSFKTEKEVLDGKVVINEVEKIKAPDGSFTWGATSRICFKDKSGNVKGSIAVTKNITDTKNKEIEVQLFNELINGVTEKLPAFLFGFNADGSIQYLSGKLSTLINPENKSSIYDVFSKLEKLLDKDQSQYTFNHAVKEKDSEWGFDVIVFKNNGTNNGYIGFGIDKDLEKYDATIKSAITSLLKTKDNLDKLKK